MVGDDRSLSVWSSPWFVEGDMIRIPLMKNILVDLKLKVSSHIWNQNLLVDLFSM